MESEIVLLADPKKSSIGQWTLYKCINFLKDIVFIKIISSSEAGERIIPK